VGLGQLGMNWHRLFGLILTDFFSGSPYVVELEKDLGMQKQLLDVLLLRRGPGRFARRLSDGLDQLAPYNLMTFKSHQEPLTDWTLKELTGHFVNLRKQLSPPRQPFLPEADFALYAVTSRFPHNLNDQVPLAKVAEGVYDCRRGTDVIRVIVAGEVAKVAHNAVWHLFGAAVDRVGFGAEPYRQRSEKTSSLLCRLFEGYQAEGIIMPYTMADFEHDFVKEHLKVLSLKERLEGLSPEERLEGLSPKELEELRKKLEKKPSPRPRNRRRQS
jgi:hypothetical protein